MDSNSTSKLRQFLIYLAQELKVSAATQNQALNALVFLYREVLQLRFGQLEPFVRAKRPEHLPVVLTKAEVRSLLGFMSGVPRVVALLMYLSGLRLLECLSLRVKDLDFERMEIRLRRGKGGKDRVTMLPSATKTDLLEQLQRAQTLHKKDLTDGAGQVALPDAIGRKYPNAPTEWRWQFVFPASSRYLTGCNRLHADFERGIFFGKGLVEAYQYGEGQDWIGLSLCPTAVERLESLGIRMPSQYALWDVPWKDKPPQKLYANVLGSEDRGRRPVWEKVKEMMSRCNRSDIKRKYSNTLDFLNHNLPAVNGAPVAGADG